MPLVYGEDERVTQWVAARAGNTDPTPSYASIGYERNGELVAGVYFDGRSETNVFAHIASAGRGLPSELLYAVARFAFGQLGALRMTFSVRDTNVACLRLVQAMGATKEAVMKKAHASGDVVLFVLWRDCGLYQRLKKRFEKGVCHGR
jgi:RimJ/RimL family protein N-acetyltransferase